MLAILSRRRAGRIRSVSPLACLLFAGLSAISIERARAQEGVDAPKSSEDVQHLDAVVVTGSRTERTLGDAPVATEVISREQIEESGARDVAELLEDRPGIVIERSFAGAGAELEGLPSDYTLILVDGVRVPGRINGVLDLSRFSSDSIERIEIVRGAGSALYGSDAIAGVINVITRRASRPLELGGNLSAGPNGRLDVSGSGGAQRGPASLRLSAGRHASDGFDLDPSNVATTQGAFQQYDVTQNSELKISSGLRLASSAEYMRRARQGIDQSGAGAVFDRDNLTQTASVGLRPELALGSGLLLHLRTGYSLFRDEFELDQRGSDALDDRQDTREQLAEVGAQLDALLGSHLLSAGTEGSYESLSTERLANGHGDRTRLGLYVQDEWTLHESPLLVLTPGARLDIDSQFGTAPTPRVAVRFDPVREITLRASYGWGFKAPDFRELYLRFENASAGYEVEGSTDLDPERSRNLAASAEFRPHRSLSLSLQGFYNLLDDRIDTALVPALDMGPQRFSYRNVNSALTRGLIAALSVSPLAGLKLEFSYDLTDAYSREAGEPRLSGVPAQRATASLRYRAPNVGFETSWRGTFVGKRPFYQDTDSDGTDERRDAYGYASIDVRVAQRIGSGFRGFFLGENLLNAGDAKFLALAPRAFSGGVEYEY